MPAAIRIPRTGRPTESTMRARRVDPRCSTNSTGAASALGQAAAPAPAQRSGRCGHRGRRSALPGSLKQGHSHPARLLSPQRRTLGLLCGQRSRPAHRQRCGGKRHPQGDQPAPEGSEHLLVEAERRGHADASFLLQGRTLELAEKHGKSIIHVGSRMTRKNGNAPHRSNGTNPARYA